MVRTLPEGAPETQNHQRSTQSWFGTWGITFNFSETNVNVGLVNHGLLIMGVPSK